MNSMAAHSGGLGLATRNTRQEIIEVSYPQPVIDLQLELINCLQEVVGFEPGQNFFSELNADQRISLHASLKAAGFDDWAALLEFARWHWDGVKPSDPSRYWQFPDADPFHESIGKWPANPTPNRYVKVTNPGNPPDENHFGMGRYGAVAKPFQIARRKVNRSEYAAFLNAVAPSDPHGLFSSDMGIVRTREDGHFRYQVRQGRGAQPVTQVSWYDALRYCNWLHHGQPTGTEGPTSTEDGAYDMSQSSSHAQRRAGAKYFLPTIDEWFKAAYYDPSQKRYALFPLPDKENSTHGWKHFNRSHYGMRETEDPIWEWTESNVGRLFRGLRSDSWFQGNNRQAAGHFYSNPDISLNTIGFRVAADHESRP